MFFGLTIHKYTKFLLSTKYVICQCVSDILSVSTWKDFYKNICYLEIFTILLQKQNQGKNEHKQKQFNREAKKAIKRPNQVRFWDDVRDF